MVGPPEVSARMSSTRAGSRPGGCSSDSASDSVCQHAISSRWTASFIVAPASQGPMCCSCRHSCRSSSLALSRSAASLPTKPGNLPSVAGRTLLPTGHSRKQPPAATTHAPTACGVAGPPVHVSMINRPPPALASRPSESSYTWAGAASSVSMLVTVPWPCPSARGLSTQVAPTSSSGCARAAVRFHTPTM